uniref:RBR-type E3 ubiquitin transferase n=1 Tax=Nothobranchius pienaari TaxID=704102 RepID=A0A1A8PAB5_9TELE
MGSEKDSESSHSSVSGVPNPKCHSASKHQSRISFHSLFHRKRGSRGSKGPKGGAAPPLTLHQHTQQLQPSALTSTPTAASATPTTTTSKEAASSTPSRPLSSSQPSLGGGESHLLECPLCLVRQPPEQLPELLGCSHRSCLCCLRQYLRIEITESRVQLSCPECTERLAPRQVADILDDAALLEKYEEFLLRRCLASDPDCRWCPAPDCGFAVIASGCASCPRLVCRREGCGAEFCYHCKQAWHPNQTCDSARQQRAQSLHTHSPSYTQDQGPADDIKPCPRCGAYIIKMNDGSCNHMTCAVCGCEFCWLCMKEISDLHYLSPSGCTFWGKKPWSRKKKILWQLGTLVGAPVGIALIAGIAIPAMIIGIPVYVGRKIHNRYEGKGISNHKRNLVIAGGVSLSVIVSPVVAAVTVGIGIPIMLAYVYGVVPISLCRSGGCGVSAGNGKGVRIEFDDENDMNVGSGTAATDMTSVADTRNNPSLSEGSVEGMTGSFSASGSHVDRLGTTRDNLSETASTMALAGASITGSLSGSVMVNYLNRLEVQADVQKERCSLSGESATVSLGAVSDNGSTKAMAGSILNAYIPVDREGNDMEVQVDIESKPMKRRHHSGSSSMDDSHVGRCGWPYPSNGCTSSGSKGTSAKWAKEASCCSSSTCSGVNKSKGKVRKKGGGGGSTKINETREDMDAQLLEQRSTNSSEFDSPSLSGSLPSVADFHCSHFSEFSCSDLESMKTSCSHGSSGGDYHLCFATVSPLPEVENDRLEMCPSASLQGHGALIPPQSPTSTTSSLGNGAELSPLCFITEERVNLACPSELLQESNNNQQQAHSSWIQTDI